MDRCIPSSFHVSPSMALLVCNRSASSVMDEWTEEAQSLCSHFVELPGDTPEHPSGFTCCHKKNNHLMLRLHDSLRRWEMKSPRITTVSHSHLFCRQEEEAGHQHTLVLPPCCRRAPRLFNCKNYNCGWFILRKA